MVIGHVTRLQTDSIPQKITHILRMAGNRGGRGHPRRRWIEEITETVNILFYESNNVPTSLYFYYQEVINTEKVHEEGHKTRQKNSLMLRVSYSFCP